MMPVRGYGISTPYGKKGSYWKTCGFHTGADIAAPNGTPIYAPISGTIRHRNYGSAFGPYQFVISPSAGQPFAEGEVFFAHVLSRLADGTKVNAGQQISAVGSLGNSTGPHLHIEYHSRKQQWNCSVMRDPQPILDWYPAGGSSSNGGYPTPTSKKVYLSKLKYGQKDSDSVWYLQDALNKHSLPPPGNFTINPKTGGYFSQTDTQVRTCQKAHGYGNDPVNNSFVGPKQAEHLFANMGLTIINDLSTTPSPPSGGGGWSPGDVWFSPDSLKLLLSEVDAVWPGRSRESDGTIGDAAHSKSKSEHNPVGHPFGPEFGTKGAVHAIDITAGGIDSQRVLDHVIGDKRVWYVIHRGKIWSKTYNWAEQTYNGSNPHNSHIHISLAADDQTSAVANEKDVSPWGILTSQDLESPSDPDHKPPLTGTDYISRTEFDVWRNRVGKALEDLNEAWRYK